LTQKIVNSVGTSYTYDEIDQLKTENGGGLANTYNYDHNGNRSSRISSTGTDTYTYDDADKLLSVTRPNGTTTYTYDDCGRPTNIGSRTLTWDYEDRLTNLTGSGVPSTSYGYNGLGTRTTKSNTNGTRTYKRDGVGVTAPVLADGVSTMVPGISEKSGGQTNYVHTDRLGSMKGISNSANVTDTAEYDAFGKVISHTGTLGTQKGFASGFGYQEDGESGYKLLGNRYYDADTGRFLSRDPIQVGRNWYGYCRNSPLKWVDPEGLSEQDHYDTPDAAGKAAAKDRINYDKDTEHGGYIYMNPDGTYSYTYQVSKVGYRVELDKSKVPTYGQIVGLWHTHPTTYDQYGREGTKQIQGNSKKDGFSRSSRNTEQERWNAANLKGDMDEGAIRRNWAEGRTHNYLGGGDGVIYKAVIDKDGNFTEIAIGRLW
jgi:RHS repeat-associated protein